MSEDFNVEEQIQAGLTADQLEKTVDLKGRKVLFKKTTGSNGGPWKNSYGTLGKFRADKPTKMKVTFDDIG